MMALPHDRELTIEETRGFAIACGVFATFGQQLAKEPSLPGEQDTARLMRERGRWVAKCAAAFDRQLGSGRLALTSR